MDRHLKYWLLMGLYSSVLLAMPITVLANTNTQNSTDLPQIVSWDDGHGYLESGEMLRNGWGYDTVNPAGKYVLFDEEGAILRRSESMEAGLEDNYTGTEQVPAVIAFRAQVFDGFAGTIEAILEEQNGVTQTVFLNADNFYEWNGGRSVFCNRVFEYVSESSRRRSPGAKDYSNRGRYRENPCSRGRISLYDAALSGI